ncbi:MAG: ABC transporter substrate-binding protein [Bradyrhizobium sp.]
MRRRQFIGLIGGAAAWAHSARAQQPAGKNWRIALLASTPPTLGMVSSLRDGLRERGYIDGQNVSLEVRWLLDDNPRVAAELVGSGVDLIVAWATPAAIAAHRATKKIPIVMVSIADPVASGLAVELARPGGNVTGTSNMATELSGKIVQLLIEVLPRMKRVGVVKNSTNPSSATSLRATEQAFHALGLQIEIVDAGNADEYETAFARLSAQAVEGVVLLPDAALIKHSAKIAELALKARLPTAFQRRENAQAGGLLAYGSILDDQLRHAASFVDRILKGAKPAEIPVEQPTQFTLVVNLKTAKALGLDVPPTLLARADEVIE